MTSALRTSPLTLGPASLASLVLACGPRFPRLPGPLACACWIAALPMPSAAQMGIAAAPNTRYPRLLLEGLPVD